MGWWGLGWWLGGNNWNSWNDQYNYGGYDKYEEEPAEDDTSANEAWIAEETKLLEEEFGPGIISIMYDDDGGMMYVCDICQSQLNGRKSLDVHVNGMKHLKKKNIWEKKRRLENFKETEGETDQKKSDTDNSTGGKDTNQGGIPNLYTQPPPSVTGMHPVSFPPPLTVPPNQWNTPPPPPPAAQVAQVAQAEDKPKTNLSGGATGTLLQKLAACAVKNLKDSDLATNVIIALVKTMKEYNHTRGDTRSIEVLTEIDVKLRGLKSMMPAIIPESEKTVSKTPIKTSPSDVSNKENTPKSASITVAPDPSKTSGNSYYSSTGTSGSEASKYSSSGSGSTAYPSSDSGTWYSQGKGNTASSYSTQSTDTKKAPPNTNYTSQPPPKTGYSSNTKASTGYTNDYSSYNMTQTQTQNPPPVKDAGGYQAKPPMGYFSQPPYGQPPAAVMDIISTAPPPPPPVDNSGYAGYGNQYSGGYGGYYNTGPPGPQANGYPMKY
ncbi:uncharacterized protein [Macrobrachium rosenbergii]|uniref:uncharacterized protein n=1 Tax=Macrobrachium rosenbergii TaxID=79674 RepID=UPI0034D44669